MLNISINRTTTPKEKPDFSNLGFGKVFSDHISPTIGVNIVIKQVPTSTGIPSEDVTEAG